MRGLLRNNYYKLIASLKLILIFALLLGIVVIIFGRKNDSLLIGYVGLGIVLVPFST